VGLREELGTITSVLDGAAAGTLSHNLDASLSAALEVHDRCQAMTQTQTYHYGG